MENVVVTTYFQKEENWFKLPQEAVDIAEENFWGTVLEFDLQTPDLLRIWNVENTKRSRGDNIFSEWRKLLQITTGGCRSHGREFLGEPFYDNISDLQTSDLLRTLFWHFLPLTFRNSKSG